MFPSLCTVKKAPSSAAIELEPLMPMTDFSRRLKTSALTASMISLGTSGKFKFIDSLMIFAIS